MKKKILIRSLASLALLSAIFTSCNDDDDSIANSNLTLNISGLKDLGTNYRYEGWIVLDPTNPPVSIGTFTVNASGAMSQTVFSVASSNLVAATKVVVSIEPTVDANATISSTLLLEGTFSGNSANLSTSSFASSTGKYVLATPSDGTNTNEKSGLWFLRSLGTPLPNLSLPQSGLDLPPIVVISPATSWKYEGWVVLNGKTISTGKFDGTLSGLGGIGGSDNFNGFSSTMATPPYAGEDFLLNAPTGLTFPTDLSGATVFVTLEPNPDNSPDPFFIKPLSATIPTNAVSGTIYNMTNVISTNTVTGTALK